MASIKFQKEASVLLLSIDNIAHSEFVVTSKLFEYLGVKRPILCIGNEKGDVHEIISKLENSYVVGFLDSNNLKDKIFTYYDKMKNETLPLIKGGETFSIQNRTKDLADLLRKNIQ